MKVLSVRQPWAWAIIHGGKDVENRNWSTKFRGRLAIHAGKQFDMNKDDWHDFSMGEYGEPWHSMARGYNQQPGHVLGAIIGTVEVTDCIPDLLCDSPAKVHGYRVLRGWRSDLGCRVGDGAQLQDAQGSVRPVPARVENGGGKTGVPVSGGGAW